VSIEFREIELFYGAYTGQNTSTFPNSATLND